MVINEILASAQIGFPILSALIALPFAGMALVALLPANLAARATITVSALEMLLTLVVMSTFQTGTADLQFVERLGGIYTLGVDGISALFLPLAALLTLLASISSEANVKVGVRGYLIALLAFEATMMGMLVAADLLLFWLFFTLEFIPGYFLIAQHGTGAERKSAARHYAMMMTISALLVLAGVEMLAAAGGGDRSLSAVLAVRLPLEAQTTIFLLLCVGLGIKAPVFPLHSWLPRVLEQGPVVGISVFLVGVKVGTYAFLRIVIPTLPEAASEYFWVVATLGGIGLIYGAVIALVQTNLRRLLAYASLSHMGAVLLAMFSLNLYGLQGALLQMLSLGTAAAGLFFIAGFLYSRVGPPEIASLGGLRQRMPLLSMAFLVTALAAIGFPGTSGFNGEHLILIGAYKVHWGMALCVAFGTVLGASYFLWFYQRAFLSLEGSENAAPLPDLTSRERLIAVTMVGLVFWVGLYTSPFINVINGSVTALSQHVETRLGAARTASR
jgi:NADH-quinone oxidoreductase subunit M